ncbi:MAG: acetolactate synthase-1/3 small subunit [Gammaproteobacteria bacterium]|jgi:acetolactate synthase-1/3 small subunit
MRHILSLLVENEAGALSRISGLFSARAYNIESLTVAPTNDDSVSRMTIVTVGSDQVVEQITKQVNKLVDVIKVVDLNDMRHIEREILLIKVDSNIIQKDLLEPILKEFHGQIIDDSENTFTIELVGNGEKLDKFIQQINTDWIIEVVRSGVSGIALGTSAIKI